MNEFNNVLINETVFLDIDATDKKYILEFLSNNLLKLGRINSKEEFLKDVYIRESEGETGIEDGLAIPHGKSNSVIVTTLSVARLNKPIEWETLDDNPVDIIVLFAVENGLDVNTHHINLLAKIAGNLVDDNILKILKKSTDKNLIISQLLS